MRRLFLCFLLCLMPLRLWAGVWMPVTPGVVAQPTAGVHLDPAHHTPSHADHDCHEAVGAGVQRAFDAHDADAGYAAHAAHAAHGQATTPTDSGVHSADCHDGTCQLCGVCHQSASLTAWPVVLPVFQAHPVPVGVLWGHVARTPPPLTKPPIS